MLTTLDNPFNPFTQFEEWYAFDEGHGYCTLGYIARIANLSSSLSEEEQEYEIDQAMKEILSFNLTGNYIKVNEEGEHVAA